MNDNDARSVPRFWRHDRHVLVSLRRAIEYLLIRRIAGQERNSAPSKVVVDMGAGSSPYRALFEDAGCTYISCDLPGELDATNSPDVELSPGVPVPLGTRIADSVVSFQVLEHVWDLDWYLGECRRLLRPEGRLMLSTHGVWPYHPHPTDYRRWTRDGLVKELESRGFKVESIVGIVGPLAWTTQFRALGYHRVLNRIPIVGPLASGVVCSFMNFRMWLEDMVTPAKLVQDNASVYVVVAVQQTDEQRTI